LDRGVAKHYDHALQAMKDVPYGRWREYDPEDTVRFYALRLHEANMVHSTPNKIIGEGTDWRFFHELKRELKA
jgi:NitT/TauT family transport system substrate-binding protein